MIFFRPTYGLLEGLKIKQKNPPKWTENQIWQGQLCNSQDDTIKDLLLFGKDVKAF